MRCRLKFKEELTKPLKDIQVKWLNCHWWSSCNMTESLVHPKLNYTLKQNQLKTLILKCELNCSVTSTYLCLLRNKVERNKFEGRESFFMNPIF